MGSIMGRGGGGYDALFKPGSGSMTTEHKKGV
jgi:hypothetical protein